MSQYQHTRAQEKSKPQAKTKHSTAPINMGAGEVEKPTKTHSAPI